MSSSSWAAVNYALCQWAYAVDNFKFGVLFLKYLKEP